ncbi:hypothetical protein JNO48_09230 [Clostridiales bacterium]|nr:hypothetical protein JNO48_09230 [Clostridiales bacterium]
MAFDPAIMEMMQVYAYCFFCETQRCKVIAELIRMNYGYICFAPQIIQRKWMKGIPTEEAHDWLPGYIFIYSDEKINPRFAIDGIIRCLGNEELHGRDREFAEMLYQQNGIIGNAPLVQEGDLCILSDPSWQGMHGTVIKMDRGRKRCCIEFEFDGIARTIWVGYNLLEPDKSTENS